jgi:DNA-binding IclR family transcriptional regulator
MTTNTPAGRRQQILSLLTERPGLQPSDLDAELGTHGTWPELLTMLKLGLVKRDRCDRYFLPNDADPKEIN